MVLELAINSVICEYKVQLHGHTDTTIILNLIIKDRTIDFDVGKEIK